MANGSGSGQWNTQDLWNVVKHIGIVAAAAVVTEVGKSILPLVDQLGQPLVTTLLTGMITAVVRWLQDNSA